MSGVSRQRSETPTRVRGNDATTLTRLSSCKTHKAGRNVNAIRSRPHVRVAGSTAAIATNASLVSAFPTPAPTVYDNRTLWQVPLATGRSSNCAQAPSACLYLFQSVYQPTRSTQGFFPRREQSLLQSRYLVRCLTRQLRDAGVAFQLGLERFFVARHSRHPAVIPSVV